MAAISLDGWFCVTDKLLNMAIFSVVVIVVNVQKRVLFFFVRESKTYSKARRTRNDRSKNQNFRLVYQLL